MRILIVDDDYVSRTKLKALLSMYGDCDTVPNGELALEFFNNAHSESVPYDLITLDIDMPGMNGHEVIDKMSEWEMANEIDATKSAKLLMITIKQNSEDIMSSFRKGCHDYIKKPVTQSNIQVALENIGLMKNL